MDISIDPLTILVLGVTLIILLYAVRKLLEPTVYVRVEDKVNEHNKKYKEHSAIINDSKQKKIDEHNKRVTDQLRKEIEADMKREEADAKKREADAKKREADAKKREADAKKKREADAKKRESDAKKREAEAKKKNGNHSNHKTSTNGTVNGTTNGSANGTTATTATATEGFELLNGAMKGFDLSMHPPRGADVRRGKDSTYGYNANKRATHSSHSALSLYEGFEMRSDDLVGDVNAAFAGGLAKPKPEVGRGSAEIGGVAGRIVIPASCPNVLIKQGERYYLHNTRKAEIPGINPIVFENLEDYTEFIRWQRMNGIRCPVLSLQETNEGEFIANGNIPNCEDIVGLPQWSLLEDAGRTKGNIPAFDGRNQDIGLITPLDMIRRRGGNTSI
jgi:hypothetical protein